MLKIIGISVAVGVGIGIIRLTILMVAQKKRDDDTVTLKENGIKLTQAIKYFNLERETIDRMSRKELIKVLDFRSKHLEFLNKGDSFWPKTNLLEGLVKEEAFSKSIEKKNTIINILDSEES